MAISFVNVGAIANGTSGNITPVLPASIAAGDILVLVVGSADNVSVSLPAAYTKKVELNSSTNCRLTVAWARATGSDSNPLVTHAAGNSIFGVIGAFRGCKTAGDPFTDAQSQANAGTTTTITAPTITPLSGDFVIFAAACGEGGTNNGGAQSITAWSGANPTLTERADYPDSGLGANLIDGGFATGPSTGGATGSRTATLSISAQATANSVGALLALTQDAGGSSFPQTAMLPLTGLAIPGQPAVAPPIGPASGSDPSAFDVITPLPIAQFVNPISLALGLGKLFPSPQPYVQPSTSIVFNDSGSGTITLSGTGTESASFADSGTGTITLSGTRTESQAHSAPGSGTITLSGTGTQSASYADSRSGTITLSGSGTESRSTADSGSGTITLSGSGTQSWSVSESRSGTITLSGSGVENFQPPGGSPSIDNKLLSDPNVSRHIQTGVR